MTSTPSRASWWAISSFSVVFSEMPGDCSPSRSVVSKRMTRWSSVMAEPLYGLPLAGEQKERAEVEPDAHDAAESTHLAGPAGPR